MQVTVKEATVNTLVAAEVAGWFFIGEKRRHWKLSIQTSPDRSRIFVVCGFESPGFQLVTYANFSKTLKIVTQKIPVQYTVTGKYRVPGSLLPVSENIYKSEDWVSYTCTLKLLNILLGS